MTSRASPCEPLIPLLDLGSQHAPLRAELTAAFTRVIASERYILGAEVAAFEAELARLLGAPHVLGVSSGTDALVVALTVAGVGPGAEVITTPYSFFATAEAILRVGATPVFVDVDAESACLDVERVEARVTARTRAILPVHLFGAPAAPARLAELAARRGLRLIEDACQALGGSVDGRSLGTWGDAGCFSFFPSKPLGTVGDGGAVAFRDPLLFERARALRSHGAPERHLHTEIGGNYRLDELHAALLRVKLPHVETWRAARAAHARRYDAAFAELEGLELVGSGARSSSAHAHYVVRVLDGRRAPLMDALARDGVQTAVYYPRPLHLQPALSELGYRRGSFPVSERAAEELLALPLYAELPDRAIERIIHAVRSGLARSRRG